MIVQPELLMGEAGLCGFWAMVAVAYVYQRNQRMHGWQEQIDKKAVYASQAWRLVHDPSDGARFVFSAEDLIKPAVQRILKRAGPPKRVFLCKIGKLFFY